MGKRIVEEGLSAARRRSACMMGGCLEKEWADLFAHLTMRSSFWYLRVLRCSILVPSRLAYIYLSVPSLGVGRAYHIGAFNMLLTSYHLPTAIKIRCTQSQLVICCTLSSSWMTAALIKAQTLSGSDGITPFFAWPVKLRSSQHSSDLIVQSRAGDRSRTVSL